MTRLTRLLPLLAALGACKGDTTLFTPMRGFRAGPARLLSTGSPTKDEDPSVLVGVNGGIYVAWFSDRGGNSDIYLTRTFDGTTWASPIRVTTDPGGDFYPQLLQAGVFFHLVWFRWTAPNVGHIYHNTSRDGVTWDPGTEEQVTKTPNVDDWVPTVVAAQDGTLLVYFVSAKRDTSVHNSEIYVARKAPGDTAWSAAVKAVGINDSTQNDHLPFAASTGISTITLVWVRHDSTQAIPYLANKTHLWYATSANGLVWTAPQRITNDTDFVVHLFPQLYSDLSQQQWSLLWLSNRLGPVKVYELPWTSFGQYTTATVENASLPSAAYSHRIAPAPVPPLYFAAWVQGPDGAQDIYYRFFEK